VRRRRLLFLPLLLCLVAAAPAAEGVHYTISLERAAENLAHVTMKLPPGAPERTVHLPVWNALYQVRDFSQYVRNVRAFSADKHPLSIRKTEKSTWRLTGAAGGATVEYDVVLDMPGAFGAQLNSEHAFLNLALVLMFAPDTRGSPAEVLFRGFNPQHRIVTSLRQIPNLSAYGADDYDLLVDSPVEIGPIQYRSFRSGNATYHFAVHAPSKIDMGELERLLKRIVDAGVWYMQDTPFQDYTFLFHFPERTSGGGMEHAYSTAIDYVLAAYKTNQRGFASLSAHEFFHLWNVKRIRSTGLEPTDYLQEDYSDALWFAEGVTSTVAEQMLMRAALMKEDDYLERLAAEISDLENRPAKLDQSAAESSLETWLDKYPAYRLPERSISYYNKGQILGVLLDLEMREATGNRKSLRDLFAWLNQLAKRKQSFRESDGLREAAEAVTGADFKRFFADYVMGTQPLPYERLFATVGLRLEKQARVVAHAGFTATRNFDQPPVVAAVDAEAARAGIEIGDTVTAINGERVTGEVEDRIERLSVGSTARVRLSGRRGVREVKVKITGREIASFRLRDLQDVTPAQRARRRSWLMSETPAAAKAAAR
jgi:predicted metalloprotease with PDZ domain